jgi:hypothetical protein
MENIKGKIQIGDKKITLEPYDGEKEVWIRKLNPVFEAGDSFIRFRSQYFSKK